MAWIAVNQCGNGYIFRNKPKRKDTDTNYGYWQDDVVVLELQDSEIVAEDYSIFLPSKYIDQLAGKHLTWADEPVQLT